MDMPTDRWVPDTPDEPLDADTMAQLQDLVDHAEGEWLMDQLNNLGD